MTILFLHLQKLNARVCIERKIWQVFKSGGIIQFDLADSNVLGLCQFFSSPATREHKSAINPFEFLYAAKTRNVFINGEPDPNMNREGT